MRSACKLKIVESCASEWMSERVFGFVWRGVSTKRRSVLALNTFFGISSEQNEFECLCLTIRNNIFYCVCSVSAAILFSMPQRRSYRLVNVARAPLYTTRHHHLNIDCRHKPPSSAHSFWKSRTRMKFIDALPARVSHGRIWMLHIGNVGCYRLYTIFECSSISIPHAVHAVHVQHSRCP